MLQEILPETVSKAADAETVSKAAGAEKISKEVLGRTLNPNPEP